MWLILVWDISNEIGPSVVLMAPYAAKMMKLGELKQVALREVWVHEAHVFTKWLAEEENLALLANELDLDITLIESEASIGKFNVDILAKEITSDRKIVIENQLEQTNHDHLGKLITYASGVDAAVAVWVVAKDREEHKRAIDWLNEHTDEDVSFFLVRVELWQIDKSVVAPKFVIISQPNDWAKTAKNSVPTGGQMTMTKALQLDFWEQFREYGQAHESKLKLRKASPHHWFDIGTGVGNWYISLTVNSHSNSMACQIYIADDMAVFAHFRSKRKEIETKLGAELEWLELSGRKSSRIRLSVPCKIQDIEKWPEYFSWLLSWAERFRDVFVEFQT
jgi:hypothetical protein